MIGAVRPRTWIGALVVVALIVRIALVITTPHYYALTDAREFDNDAVTLVHDGSFPSSPLTARGGPTAFRPPLFPIALAAVYELVGTGSAKDRWEAGRMMEALLGAVAGLASEHGVVVLGMEAADVSYPGFMDDIEALAS